MADTLLAELKERDTMDGIFAVLHGTFGDRVQLHEVRNKDGQIYDKWVSLDEGRYYSLTSEARYEGGVKYSLSKVGERVIGIVDNEGVEAASPERIKTEFQKEIQKEMREPGKGGFREEFI